MQHLKYKSVFMPEDTEEEKTPGSTGQDRQPKSTYSTIPALGNEYSKLSNSYSRVLFTVTNILIGLGIWHVRCLTSIMVNISVLLVVFFCSSLIAVVSQYLAAE